MANQYELDRRHSRDYLNSKYTTHAKPGAKSGYVQFDETRKFPDQPKDRLNVAERKIN